jgi:hypothetical protein
MSLDKLEADLKELCPQLPHWQQLLIQGFWYGTISWLMTCVEDCEDPKLHPLSVRDVVIHADHEFETWPTEWLKPYLDEFITLNLNLEQLNDWFDKLDVIFRDCIPTDLDIFTILAEGNVLSEEQWERLYNALAFLPPDTSGFKKNHAKHKTRRLHGRRAITPMRRRRAITHHNKHPLNIIKMK